MGAHVCKGCQGTVIYGATRQELNNYPLLPALVAFFLMTFFLGLGGSHGWRGGAAFAVAVIVYIIARGYVRQWRAGMIRTFRRM
ncbi:MAG: hypothetical protein PHE83_16260 [Opitutaceae bacterium]|nr:hypothetical protein [Opitutaceae bacterium]